MERKPETTVKDAEDFMAYYYDNKLKWVNEPTSETLADLRDYEMALSVEENVV